MAEARKPSLTEDIREDIARAQHEVDKRYWVVLQPLLISPWHELQAAIKALPLPPRQPIRVCELLASYACSLFAAEASEYPSDSPDLEGSVRSLAKEIEDKMLRVARGQIFVGGLTYHATEERIVVAVRAALERCIAMNATKKLPAQISTPEAPEPPKPEIPTGNDTASRRMAFVIPLLEAKGWSI